MAVSQKRGWSKWEPRVTETMTTPDVSAVAIKRPSGTRLANLWIRDRWFRIVVMLLALFFAGIVLGPIAVSWSPVETEYHARNQGPGGGHLLGTDSMGRDTLARALAGGKISILIGVAGMLLAFWFGGVAGLAASALGGIADTIYFGFIDLLRAMPGPLLSITLVMSLGQGIAPVVIALGFVYSPMFSRMARSLYRREMAMDYVVYSQANNASVLSVMRRHVAPNLYGTFLTQCSIVFPRAIVTESVLSFLGMGVSPETPTWGKMISIESPFFEANPLAVLVPVVFLSLFTTLFAVLGTKLRSAE
ncbi:MAG TPA: ABC transporter permease [Spirochaetaceae bacterium]|nr:ABC transporter permease [Spirochaetaceae bacterium]